MFIHDTLRESNQPDAGYTNTVIIILRTIASEKNTLFQPNDTTKFADLQNSLFIFFQSHNENLRLASMGALAADAVVAPHRAWQNVVEEAFGLSDISF